MIQVDRYLTLSAAAFALVALAHVARALAQWSIVIGPWPVPIAASWLAAIVTAALSAWAFSLLRNRRR